MRRNSFGCIAVILVAQVLATAAGSQAPTVRINDLHKNPLDAGSLRFTISKLKATRLLGGNGTIDLRIDNQSDSFTTFAPSHLVFVGADGHQVDVFGIALFKSVYNPGDTDLAPHAYVEPQYTLTDEIALPAKLYYDRQLLAQITK
ncbi:MAG TPA: hypothetical protein VLZ81_09525 [Blastocatellia bacterium]|nr:hypothetical protein [Blastocatellia bacterium]